MREADHQIPEEIRTAIGRIHQNHPDLSLQRIAGILADHRAQSGPPVAVLVTARELRGAIRNFRRVTKGTPWCDESLEELLRRIDSSIPIRRRGRPSPNYEVDVTATRLVEHFIVATGSPQWALVSRLLALVSSNTVDVSPEKVRQRLDLDRRRHRPVLTRLRGSGAQELVQKAPSLADLAAARDADDVQPSIDKITSGFIALDGRGGPGVTQRHAKTRNVGSGVPAPPLGQGDHPSHRIQRKDDPPLHRRRANPKRSDRG